MEQHNNFEFIIERLMQLIIDFTTTNNKIFEHLATLKTDHKSIQDIIPDIRLELKIVNDQIKEMIPTVIALKRIHEKIPILPEMLNSEEYKSHINESKESSKYIQILKKDTYRQSDVESLGFAITSLLETSKKIKDAYDLIIKWKWMFGILIIVIMFVINNITKIDFLVKLFKGV